MKTFEVMIHEIASDLGLLCESRYEGMHSRFKEVLTGKMIYLIGNHLPLNTHTSCRLAADKGLSTEILNESNIQSVQHKFLHEVDLDNLLEEESLDIFIKPIRGLGGKCVHHITSTSALRRFKDNKYLNDSWCYSPTELYDVEYRLTILDGECIAIYGKTKGNNNQNNLSAGATAFEVDLDSHKDLAEIAIASANSMDIRFCNVDVFYDVNGQPKIMEINSSICFKSVLNASDNLYKQCKEAYKKAILLLLDEASLETNKQLQYAYK